MSLQRQGCGDLRVDLRRQYIADAFGSSCAFAQVRHTSTTLIKRFGLEHDHLPKVVALTRDDEDALYFVEHTGMICLEGIIEFLRKLRQNVKEDGGPYDGPVYLDGRKRSLRWGDEHRDKTVDEGIRDKIILARYCKHNIAADISAEMDAVVRQLHGLRAGCKNLASAPSAPSCQDGSIVTPSVCFLCAERFLLSSMNREFEQSLDVVGSLPFNEVHPFEQQVAEFHMQVCVSSDAIPLNRS